MKREVERELLDELPPEDPRAVHARRDLQKVNAWMGHAGIMARILAGAFRARSPQTLVELGAGDGTFLLRLARRIAPCWGPLTVVLVDRQPLLSPRTKREFEALSWKVESAKMDVFAWLERLESEPCDVMVANLFLHHFADKELSRLLRQAARQTGLFLACEPWRFEVTLGAAGLLWLIGCNEVTRHDAKVSVRAGFRDHELSALWPADGAWRLEERRAGLFSHCFVAMSERTREEITAVQFS